MRQAFRSNHDRMLAGVASGLAEHLDRPVLHVRAAFIGLALLNGLGVVLYGLCWAFLPLADDESATNNRTAWWRDSSTLLAALALLLGGFGLLNAIGLVSFDSNNWGVALALAGGLALWMRADTGAISQRWLRSDLWLAVAGGIGLGVGVLLMIGSQTGAIEILRSLFIIALLLGGLSFGVLPLWLRRRREQTAAREADIRKEERDALAAHLHDSVLQTLTLIQKRSDNAEEINRLARTGETSLREWLYPRSGITESGFSNGLRKAAAEIEAEFAVSIDVVTVGDCEATAENVELLAAAREAILNAAKHAQVAHIQVYSEVQSGQIQVFVRDRGIGFDPNAVAADRHGISNSIKARMQRVGGVAEVKSAVGNGTEVQLLIGGTK